MNLDKLGIMHDQLAEHRIEGCVGETIADIIGNITGVPLDPDFSEAGGYAVQGAPVSNLGETAVAALYGAVAYGALPDVLDKSDPAQTNELTENNFANYTSLQKTTAAGFAQKGIRWLNSYDEIVLHLNQYKTGVAVGFKWYQSFSYPYLDGTLRTPNYANETFTYHETACYETTPSGLRIKPWLGADYGDKGYVYMPRTLFNIVSTGAAAFDPNASRWFFLIKACLQYPQNIPSLLPLVFKASTMK